jgi:hypothetical protein
MEEVYTTDAAALINMMKLVLQEFSLPFNG